MAVGFVASASSGSQASVASFNIGTLGTGARAGIVFVCTHNSGTAVDTGVTWNGVAMGLLYSATDTDTEPGVTRAYFLDNVTNGTITVTRTNNATVCVGYAASISAASATQAFQTITRVSSTQNTDANTSTTGTGTSGEVAVDDGSPGTNSMRFAAAYSGAATPPLQGTNSTNLQVLDSTAFGSRFVRETTAGQGSRSVGFATGTTDDWALVAVAVREAPPAVTGTGAGTGTASSGSGAAAETMTGTGVAAGVAATGSGTATETMTGTGAGTGAASSGSGTGETVGDATGTGAGTQAAQSGSGTAVMLNATGAGTQAAQSAAGSGTETITGTGAGSGTASSGAGSAAETLTGTGAATGRASTGSGSGAETFTGTGAGVQAAQSGSGSDLQPVTGTGAGTGAAETASGLGIGDGSARVDDAGGVVQEFRIIRRAVQVQITASGVAMQAAAAASGTGTVNDDELVLEALAA